MPNVVYVKENMALAGFQSKAEIPHSQQKKVKKAARGSSRRRLHESAAVRTRWVCEHRLQFHGQYFL